eukprot:scaffold170839_cov36-Attheya_sp.AAC.1
MVFGPFFASRTESSDPGNVFEFDAGIGVQSTLVNANPSVEFEHCQGRILTTQTIPTSDCSGCFTLGVGVGNHAGFTAAPAQVKFPILSLRRAKREVVARLKFGGLSTKGPSWESHANFTATTAWEKFPFCVSETQNRKCFPVWFLDLRDSGVTGDVVCLQAVQCVKHKTCSPLPLRAKQISCSVLQSFGCVSRRCLHVEIAPMTPFSFCREFGIWSQMSCCRVQICGVAQAQAGETQKLRH